MLEIWKKLNNIEKNVLIVVISFSWVIAVRIDILFALWILGIAILLIFAETMIFFSNSVNTKQSKATKKNDNQANSKSANLELVTNLNIETPYVGNSHGCQLLLKDDYVFITKGKKSQVLNCLANNTWESLDPVELKIPLDVITVINYRESGLYKGYLEFIYQGYNARYRDVIKHLQENVITFDLEQESQDFFAFKEIVENRIRDLKLQSNKSSLSVADEIKKLADLQKQGILSEEEFLLQKKKIMEP